MRFCHRTKSLRLRYLGDWAGQRSLKRTLQIRLHFDRNVKNEYLSTHDLLHWKFIVMLLPELVVVSEAESGRAEDRRGRNSRSSCICREGTCFASCISALLLTSPYIHLFPHPPSCMVAHPQNIVWIFTLPHRHYGEHPPPPAEHRSLVPPANRGGIIIADACQAPGGHTQTTLRICTQPTILDSEARQRA